jgi:hypothetical protein
VFLSLSIADYSRYLCEVVPDEKRDNIVKQTEDFYKNFFDIADRTGLHIVNPCFLTGYYHFCIFIFEILEKKGEAIHLLKSKHQEIIDNLDTAYTIYVDSYSILELITETLTVWIVSTNYKNINSTKAL